MHVFWRQGYGSTSIEDLVAASGVNRASLYKIFGDKHALFVAALRHYSTQHLATLKATLHQPERAVEGIRNVIEAFARISSDRPGMVGCLLGTATLERLPHDRVVAQLVARCYAARRLEFTRALTRARTQGDVQPDIDIAATAAYLVTYLQGMRMMGKTRLAHADARKAALVAYAALGIATHRAS